MSRRRSSVDILHDILKLCENDGAKKTAIMYGGNLSYDQLRRYLNVLTRRGIVAKSHLGVYQITTKGHHPLELVFAVVAVLEDLHAALDGDRSGEGPLVGNGHREEQAVAVD